MLISIHCSGDLCDSDMDNDGVPNEIDNCLIAFNPEQNDTNRTLLQQSMKFYIL